jgi:hypothetical protein
MHLAMLYEVAEFIIVTPCQIKHVMLQTVSANVVTRIEVLEGKLSKYK